MDDGHRIFSIRFPDPLFARVARLVSKDGRYRSINAVISECVRRAISELESETKPAGKTSPARDREARGA